MNNQQSDFDSVEIESRLLAIEIALRGDLKGNAGALQNLIRLMNDVYNAPEGVKHRITLLEGWKQSKEDRFAGAAWVVKLGWSAGGLILGWLLHYLKVI